MLDRLDGRAVTQGLSTDDEARVGLEMERMPVRERPGAAEQPPLLADLLPSGLLLLRAFPGSGASNREMSASGTPSVRSGYCGAPGNSRSIQRMITSTT
jgi:hypothetical protein